MIVNSDFTHQEAMLYHIAVRMLDEVREYHENLRTYNRSSWLNKLINNPPKPPLPTNSREHLAKELEKLFPAGPPCGCNNCKRRDDLEGDHKPAVSTTDLEPSPGE